MLEGVPICLSVSTINSIEEYPFHEVSRKELMKHRLSGKPGIVYKLDNKFFYAKVPGILNIVGKGSYLGAHMCGKNCTKVCAGCPRTSDLTVPYQMREAKSFFEAVINSWRIEKYDFIVQGIEAFNMECSNDAMIVIECKCYNHRAPKTPKPKSVGKVQVLHLANFVWPDFDGTYDDLRRRIYK